MLIGLIKWINVANKILGLPFINSAGEVEIPNDVALTGADSDLHLKNNQKLTGEDTSGTRKTLILLSGDEISVGESNILKGATVTRVHAAGGSGKLYLLANNSGFIIDASVPAITSNMPFDFNFETRKLNTSAQWVYASGLITGGTTPVWGYSFDFNATITRNGAGDYSVTFSTAFTDTNYSPICTVHANNYNASVLNRAAGGFDIKVYDATGTLTDADVGVVVFGKSY